MKYKQNRYIHLLLFPLVLLTLLFISNNESRAAALPVAPNIGVKSWTFYETQISLKPGTLIVTSTVKCSVPDPKWKPWGEATEFISRCAFTDVAGAKITCPKGYEPYKQATDGSSSLLKAGWYCYKPGATTKQTGVLSTLDLDKTVDSSIVSYYINEPAKAADPAPAPAPEPSPSPTPTPAPEPPAPTPAPPSEPSPTPELAAPVSVPESSTPTQETLIAADPVPAETPTPNINPDPLPTPSPAPAPTPAPGTQPIQRRLSGGLGPSNSKTFQDITEKTKNYEEIHGLLTRMMEFGTFEMPQDEKFGPTKKTRGLLALQIALTVAKIPCEKRARDSLSLACQRKAQAIGLMERLKHGFITKVEFYGLIIKAAKLTPPIDQGEKRKLTICRDVEPESPDFEALATLHKYRLLKRYTLKGETRNCLPNTPMSRRDAAVLGWKALQL